MGLPAAEPKV
jgi:hypothetical protein